MKLLRRARAQRRFSGEASLILSNFGNRTLQIRIIPFQQLQCPATQRPLPKPGTTLCAKGSRDLLTLTKLSLTSFISVEKLQS